MPSSVNLGTQLEGFVSNLINSGRYNSRSEVLREGVRMIHEREIQLAALDASIHRGLADADQGRVMDAATLRAALSERHAAKGADETAS